METTNSFGKLKIFDSVAPVNIWKSRLSFYGVSYNIKYLGEENRFIGTEFYIVLPAGLEEFNPIINSLHWILTSHMSVVMDEFSLVLCF